MTKHKPLDASLATAEAALVRAQISSVDTTSTWTNAKLKLDYVRARCRQLRAALIELDKSESAGKVDEVRTSCRDLRAVFLELNRSATIPFRCDQPSCFVLQSPRTTCWLGHLDGMIETSDRLDASAKNRTGAPLLAPMDAIQQAVVASAAQKHRPRGIRPNPSLFRQSVDLLTLAVAYLFYFFADVQLQIVMLPSIFALTHQ